MHLLDFLPIRHLLQARRAPRGPEVQDDDIARRHHVAQINRFGGNISRTAEFVGMERSALHRKIKSLGM